MNKRPLTREERDAVLDRLEGCSAKLQRWFGGLKSSDPYFKTMKEQIDGGFELLDRGLELIRNGVTPDENELGYQRENWRPR